MSYHPTITRRKRGDICGYMRCPRMAPICATNIVKKKVVKNTLQCFTHESLIHSIPTPLPIVDVHLYHYLGQRQVLNRKIDVTSVYSWAPNREWTEDTTSLIGLGYHDYIIFANYPTQYHGRLYIVMSLTYGILIRFDGTYLLPTPHPTLHTTAITTTTTTTTTTTKIITKS